MPCVFGATADGFINAEGKTVEGVHFQARLAGGGWRDLGDKKNTKTKEQIKISQLRT